MKQYNLQDLKDKIEEIANTLAKEFNLNLHSIEYIKSEHMYGQCSAIGELKIKLEWPDGELVPEMEVWRTLGHEMAHLKHFNHNEEFWHFNKVLVLRISELVGKKIRPEVAVFGMRMIG